MALSLSNLGLLLYHEFQNIIIGKLGKRYIGILCVIYYNVMCIYNYIKVKKQKLFLEIIRAGLNKKKKEQLMKVADIFFTDSFSIVIQIRNSDSKLWNSQWIETRKKLCYYHFLSPHNKNVILIICIILKEIKYSYVFFIWKNKKNYNSNFFLYFTWKLQLTI